MEEIIALLRERGPMKTSEIAELLGISPQSAYYHLRKLESKGLVIRMGGSRGRGYSAVWKLKQKPVRGDVLSVETSFMVGKALAWINSQREGDSWSFIGVKREAVTTVLALLMNAEIEGRFLPLPSRLSLETSKRILAKEGEIEYYAHLSRYYYLLGERQKLRKSIKNLSKLIIEVSASPNITFEPVASLVVFMTKPFLEAFDDDVIDLLLQHVKRDTREVVRRYHWETALAWMALARLELGMRKEAYRLYKELLPRMVVKGDEAYLEDRPPLYLIRLYRLEKATLDPTVLVFVLSKRFGREGLARKLLNHIKRHQTSEGAFKVSEELGPDLARTEIIAYLLWHSLAY